VKVVAAWLLGLMLVVIAAIVTVFVVNTNVYGPEQQVRSYFDALRNGEGEKALGLLNASVPDANAAMLDGPALAASAQSLEDVEVGKARGLDERHVEIPVTYRLDGQEKSSTFGLEKTGTDWLFFNKWAFVPSALPTVEVSVVNKQEATLNGTEVALPDGRNRFAVFYPGKFEAAYTSENFAAPATSAVVVGRQPAEAARLMLSTEATPKLVEDVNAQVRKFLDDCTQQKVLAPAGCPFFHFTNNRIDGDINWSIAEYPEVVIEPFQGGWVLKPLSGKAELNTTEVDLFTGAAAPLHVVQDFNFTARLSVSDTSTTVAPVINY
jgi:hypothetical protein